MQKYQSQIQIEIILVYRDIKHITGIYTCWLITEYIWTKNAINENGMLFNKNPTKYSGLEQNENKNELIS